MIRFATQMLRAIRRAAGFERGPAELAAKLEALAQRNAELERAVLAQQKIADELRRLQADLSRAQRMAKIGNWRWSVPRNALIEGSDVYAEIHGVAPSEIHARMDRLLDDVVHPEDRERIERAFREADASGSDYQAEYRIVRPDGEVRHVREIGENIADASGR
ncbi:MAG TPA: PAS domain-containing protein, partial [Myxococcota bacterium]|nr:PAS domain-containing protein [Myxococcota bacterium]